ncbi:thiamine phosphate synthase [Deltaproteobacteria bacterium Smac51]|nr:thiamine phosphate synthase [Deltaproteobacteria bacterium Smac51]
MFCLITERKLCPEPLIERVEKVLAAGAPYLMLREKDLSGEDLMSLSREVAVVTRRYGARLIINSSPEAAEAVAAWGLQLPFSLFISGGLIRPGRLMKVGVSIHSRDEALAAERAGADYILAGHVFETDCKKGLPGRGLEFISELRRDLKIPVWVVGGIRPDNIGLTRAAGATVVCVRSVLMECLEPAVLLNDYLIGLNS